MAIEDPPGIDPAPPAPQRTDPATFSSRADAFVTWLGSAVAQFASLAANVKHNALEALGFAQSAQQAAQDATTNGAAQVDLAAQEVRRAQHEVQRAGQQADAAEDWARESRTAAGQSLAHAIASERSHQDALAAAAAAGAAAGLPVIEGNAGAALQVNAAGNAVEFVAPMTLADVVDGQSSRARVVSPAVLISAIETVSPALGVGQVWQGVSRSLDVVYQNATGRPITVAITGNVNAAQANGQVMGIDVSADNNTWVRPAAASWPAGATAITCLVPINHYYRFTALTGTGRTVAFLELR